MTEDHWLILLGLNMLTCFNLMVLFGPRLWRKRQRHKALRDHWRSVRTAYRFYMISPLSTYHRAGIDPREPPRFIPSELNWYSHPGILMDEPPLSVLQEDIDCMEARMQGYWGGRSSVSWPCCDRRHGGRLPERIGL